ncbi:endonuclease domain-containing protein [Pendulispora rubella]|uniref:endonuclease domain-containing protein n=1 Tax=Pendulispora rubella TaxID=2741070 RepID=UPI00374E0C40
MPERILFRYLRAKRLGAKWRRQHPIGPYVVDFYCHAARLVVELDGDSHGSHERRQHDLERDAWLRDQGLRILRFTNRDVMHRLEGVLEVLWRTTLPLPCPPPEGEGD